jgi:hypothetical protein
MRQERLLNTYSMLYQWLTRNNEVLICAETRQLPVFDLASPSTASSRLVELPSAFAVPSLSYFFPFCPLLLSLSHSPLMHYVKPGGFAAAPSLSTFLSRYSHQSAGLA